MPAPRQHRPGSATLRSLTEILYGHRFDQDHRVWQNLLADPQFAFADLDHDAAVQRAYHRLALVNAEIDDVAAFASDVHRITALHEWMGPRDAALTAVAGIHYNLFLGSLLDLEPAGRRDLAEFTDLRRVGVFLCTEAAHGNSAADLETTAVHNPATGGFVLHTPHPGARKFMPNTGPAGGAKTGLVAARLLVDGTDQGVYLFFTPLRDRTAVLPGITVEALPQASTAAVDHSLTTFQHVLLAPDALVGAVLRDGAPSGAPGSLRKRFLRSIGRVTTGKLCMSGCGVGAARTAVNSAVRYAHTRHTTGLDPGVTVPLFAHRGHHARLIEAVVATYAATLLHRYAVDRWAAATAADHDEVDRLVAVVKGWTTWRARDVVRECRERTGAVGLLRVNGLADLAASLEGPVTAEGDNLVIWTKAAAEMVFGHAVPAGTGQAADLSRPLSLQGLLADVERLWQQRARTRLRDRTHPGALPRWNNTVSCALELVDAYAHRLAGEVLLAAVDRAGDPTASILLREVHRLFALGRIAAHSGDLLATGRLTAEQVTGLPDLREAAIAALQPWAATLADGFALDDAFARGPLTGHRTGALTASR
ncbi:acyl-CoA dehydrogenase [Catellatospora sp. KI3]|uniref:acyl-CoA dehydrogenase family protein n=1 Tax=Catellatospora sp. KI3 TaxID=3041620 RepID=UPI0024824A6D|nr:acyl-CoA dehydrogenase [Catellatospora sp. KI3]MDI1463239.1 acyl-CoA dehydrogenase [Catellatospora sp. KI3]